MRFLNTTTYELVEGAQIQDNAKEYAILSHTWLDNHLHEVTYRDLRKFSGGLRKGTWKPDGWRKVTKFCNFARDRGHKLVWMDTCCIDKKDVLETQTSIHGMYDFYANAVVCYAYLADVSGVGAPEERNAQVKRSRWFTRGWTLQEWLAPRSLVYLDQEWRVIGTREHFDDIPRLSSTFKRFTQPRILSVRFWNLATKLSWASQRQTTMLEDQAYSICGLLQIKLPVRYGQNDTKSVFRHLQEALINEYHDLSLLAWFDSPDAQQGYLRRHGSKPSELGVLAPSIDFFPEVPADWDRFIPGGAGVYIESDCLRVRTRIFELESAIKSSGVESSTQMLAVELHSHNASSRDRVGIVVVRSRRKDHYVRKFHNRGLFRINYHNGEDTCQGFFGHRQWRWTDDQWYKARFMGFKDIYIDYH